MDKKVVKLDQLYAQAFEVPHNVQVCLYSELGNELSSKNVFDWSKDLKEYK